MIRQYTIRDRFGRLNKEYNYHPDESETKVGDDFINKFVNGKDK